MKSIVLAEKPSVGKDLARVLNCSQKHKKYCEGKDYIVTWGLGHLVTLADPEDYEHKWREWKLEDLPMLPKQMDIKVIKKTLSQFREVKRLMKRKDVKELIIATDAGREGELVARWIMKAANWRKPFSRLWISSQTDQAIREGFKNLKPGKQYENLYQAAVCRAEADWLVGMNVTRAMTCKFNIQLNAGRVQTPTLAMIVNREKEIQNFVPKDYWTLQVQFDDYFGTWRDKNGQTRIFDYNRVTELSEKVRGHEGKIVDIQCQNKSEPAPLAYDLTELQRDANKRFNFSAKKTLATLQTLYERHKLVTYPRTDSRHITSDMVATLPARLKAISVSAYQKHTKSLLSQGKISPGKRFVNDSKVSDHHAIIPTEEPVKLEKLSADERKIHDMIVRRFLSVLYPPYKYQQLTITTEVNGEKFYSRGKVTLDPGWKQLHPHFLSNDDDDEDRLPEQSLKQQQQGAHQKVHKCEVKKSQTTPPARYTEGTLLSAMENPGQFIQNQKLKQSIQQGGGLGTPATRAEIIEKLLNNHYLERKGNRLLPTSKANQLIELVPDDLRHPELTAKWELRLNNIANGKENSKKFIQDIRHNAQQLVNLVKKDDSSFELDNLTKNKCPFCDSYMLAVQEKQGKMLVCSERSCGHRQPEQLENIMETKGKKNRRRGRSGGKPTKYTDGQIGTNLGDLLQQALDEPEKKK